MKKVKVLIVDDEPNARDYLELLLEKVNRDLEITGKAENAQQALEMIMDSNPDLVLLDIVMPGNNGFWLIDKLSKFGKTPSFVLVTAYDKYMEKAMNYAAIDFLLKPVSMDELQNVIDRFNDENGNHNTFEKIDRLHEYLTNNRLIFNFEEKKFELFVNEIVFLKIRHKKIHITLVDGSGLVVDDYSEKLMRQPAYYNFIKINRTVLINKNLIENFSLETKKVVLSDTIQKYEFKVSSDAVRQIEEILH